MDPPFTRLDILSCRNVLIYLSPEVQRRLIPLFHYSLKPGGILFLGTSETVGSSRGLFNSVGDGRARIYRPVAAAAATVQVEFPTPFDPQYVETPETPSTAANRLGSLNRQLLAEQILLRRYSPAAVLADERGDILYFHGRTGRVLEPAAGRASFNLLSMAREGLRQALTIAFRTALREGRAVSRNVRSG
jgi:two-component system CheB/CheR fusion protein